MAIVIKGASIEEIAEKREITKRLRAVVDNEVLWERAWKYCKNLAKFSHAPVSLSDYHKMEKYIEDTELTNAVLKALEGYLPTNENSILSGFDTIGFSYCIALLSQTCNEREYIVKYLNELAEYLVSNEIDYGAVLHRNMKRLKKEYPDLADLEKKLKCFEV